MKSPRNSLRKNVEKTAGKTSRFFRFLFILGQILAICALTGCGAGDQNTAPDSVDNSQIEIPVPDVAAPVIADKAEPPHNSLKPWTIESGSYLFKCVVPQSEAKSAFVIETRGKKLFSVPLKHTDETTLLASSPKPIEDRLALESLPEEFPVGSKNAENFHFYFYKNGPDTIVLETKHDDGSLAYDFIELGKKPKVRLAFDNKDTQLKIACFSPDNTHKIISTEHFRQWGARAVTAIRILNLSKGGLSLDAALMKRFYGDFDMQQEVKEAKALFKDYPDEYNNKEDPATILAPPEVAADIIQLCCAKEKKLARRYLELVWPEQRRGKERFWKAVTGLMSD